MSFIERAKNFLADIFNDRAFQEQIAVQNEMRKDGWTFRREAFACGFGGAVTVTFINTPEGRMINPADAATDADARRYVDLEASTRKKLGFDPK